MSAARYLPAPPSPPHDPLSLLLDKRVGWSVLEANLARADESVHLARFPASLRSLTEPSGSFGGLRTPRNVAFGPVGDLLLLDGESRELKTFDRCDCNFVRTLCFEASGTGPWALPEPAGIALSYDSLYVCDPANGRLSVYALPTLTLRGHWIAPLPWRPTCVATTGKVIYVGDEQNGMVHRFDRQGRHLESVAGVGAVQSLAIDRYGQVFAASASNAYFLGPTGPVELNAPADELVDAFDPVPFDVDRDGNLHLGPLCEPPCNVVFDPTGTAITLAGPAPLQMFENEGTLLLGPFDSRIETCVWHRVVLHGRMPTGSRIEVKTTTAEIASPVDVVTTLPDYAWETNLDAGTFYDGAWDCLIQGQPGRFLWVHLTLRSEGADTPDIESIEIEFPRITLRRYLPGVFGAEAVSADFTDRLLGLFDRELRNQESRIDRLPALFDPMATDQLDWLASWVGVSLDRQLPEALRRSILATSAANQAISGTHTGLRRMLLTFLGFDQLETACQSPVPPDQCGPPAATCPPTPGHVWRWSAPPLILEHFRLRRWLEVGSGRLGDQAALWGKSIVNRSQLGEGATVGLTQIKGSQDPVRDPFHVYAHKFTVFVPASIGDTPQKRRSLEGLVRRESPAHTEGQIRYVSPRFRIGFQSMIGLDSVVGCLPSGVRLNETPIGPASVLTGSGQKGLGTTRIGEAKA